MNTCIKRRVPSEFQCSSAGPWPVFRAASAQGPGPCQAAAGLAGASRDASCSVTSTIIMNKDFKEIGEEGSPERDVFENSLLDDLAYASGLSQEKFVIMSMSAGSVVVEVEITGDTADEAAKAAKNLQKQARNPLSRLRHGAVTSCVTSIKNKLLAIRYFWPVDTHKQSSVSSLTDLHISHFLTRFIQD